MCGVEAEAGGERKEVGLGRRGGLYSGQTAHGASGCQSPPLIRRRIVLERHRSDGPGGDTWPGRLLETSVLPRQFHGVDLTGELLASGTFGPDLVVCFTRLLPHRSLDRRRLEQLLVISDATRFRNWNERRKVHCKVHNSLVMLTRSVSPGYKKRKGAK